MELLTSKQVDLGQDVFILERSGTNLVVTNNKDYILEGIAAVFGEENNNGRIYEEAEYMPHLEYLRDKILNKRLVGELDHPEKFDVSLKHISHVIESLDYDKNTRQLKIRVRLLDTPGGRIARTLVDAGVPISISSRAAGSVMENKRVKIKKIFTYDLVADPGFEKAQLERVYENANFEESTARALDKSSILDDLRLIPGISKNIDIYSISESLRESYDRAVEEKPKSTNMNTNYVTVDEMNGWSAVIKEEFAALKAAVTTDKSEKANEQLVSNIEKRLAKLEGYSKYLAENLDKNIRYSEYLAENLDKDIEYTKYLAENLDKNISFADYLAENLEKNISYSEYLAENLDKNISYSEYLAENLDKNISYSEYLAENLDKNISYSEYLAENLDKNISYSEYLAENLDRNISYSEYLAENLDRGIGYSEYIAEKLERNIAYSEYIAESVNSVELGDAVKMNENEVVEKTTKTVKVPTDYSSLSDSINKILESANNQKAATKLYENEHKFFRFLGDDKRNEFASLDEAKKEKVANALKDGVYFSEADVTKKWDAVLLEAEQKTQEPAFLQLMPDHVRPLWESISVEDQNRTIAASKLHKLETPYQIKTFWNNRGFVKGQTVGLIKLNEDNNNTTKVRPNPKGISSEYMTNVADALGKRFGK